MLNVNADDVIHMLKVYLIWLAYNVIVLEPPPRSLVCDHGLLH